MTDTPHVVAVVVDPEFGDRVNDLVSRLPVWIADTEANRAAIDGAHTAPINISQDVSHTAIGALTMFTIDVNTTPESWCVDILGTVAAHHDRHSHSPGYSAVEVYGTTPTPELLKALAEYRLTHITTLWEGFRASTPDGQPAASPNDF